MILRAIAISATGLLLLLAAAAAIAAPLAQLTGFNGIAFETPFKVAKQRLGAKAVADKSPSSPIVNTLLQSKVLVPLYGESFVVNYTFGSDDRLKIVYAIAVTPKGNFEVCRSHWSRIMTGLNCQYGNPDTATNDIQTTTQFADTKYSFRNGAKLNALMMGCIIMLSYIAPGYSE